MTKKVSRLLCALLFALTAVYVLPAQETDNLFNAFLVNLVKKREEIKNISMPDVEVRDVPGNEDAAVYMINFKNQEDMQIFTTALEAENVIYATRPKFDLQIIMFSPDMIQYIWIQVLGF